MLKQIDQLLLNRWMQRGGALSFLAGVFSFAISQLAPVLRHTEALEVFGVTLAAIGLLVMIPRRVQRAPQVQQRPSQAISADAGPRRSGAPLPASIANWQGRETERDQLRTLLEHRQRLTCVYGRRGIGKTSLVAKVLHDMGLGYTSEALPGGFDGIVLLSGRTGPHEISMYRIYSGVAGLLGDEEQIRLLRRWDTSKEDALEDLLTMLRRRKVVVVIDNLDDIQDATTGEITRRDVADFLAAICAAPESVLMVVTTSVVRPRVGPPDPGLHLYSLQLRDGLDMESAVALLRALDVDRRAGLHDAPEARLRHIAKQLSGIPRGLELIYNLLHEDEGLIDLDEVLTGDRPSDELLDELVSKAYLHLTGIAREIVELLALGGGSLPSDAVVQLVACNSDPSPAKVALRSLTRGALVGLDNKMVSIHPLDADYVLRAFLADPARRRDMHLRLAEWYIGQHLAPTTWRRAEDADGFLMGYRHLWQGGQPARAMASLSRAAEYLTWFGYAETIRGGIADAARLQNATMEFDIAFCVGSVEATSGSLTEAVDAFRRASASAPDEQREAAALYMQAFALRHLNQPAEAIALLERLSHASRSVPRVFRARATLELGLAVCYKGDSIRAIIVAEDLERLVTDDDPPDVQAMVPDLQALIHIQAERWDEAISAAERAACLYGSSWQSATQEGYALNDKAIALVGKGDLAAAIAQWTTLAEKGTGLGNHRLRGFSFLNLAWARLAEGEWQAARDAAKQAVTSLSASGLPESAVASRLARTIEQRDYLDTTQLHRELQSAAAEGNANPDLLSLTADVLATISSGRTAGSGRQAGWRPEPSA
jgi:tetratricopeptide (TPR) repeat protein